MNELKNMVKFPVISVVFGITTGVVLSIVFDLLYVHLFQESSSQFYLFAGLALLGGPLAGGILSAIMAQELKLTALLMSGSAALVAVVALAFLSYVLLPVFSYDSVPIPASPIGDPLKSGNVSYTIPGAGTGILLTGDDNSAVVVMTDYSRLPFNSTVYLVNKTDNRILRSMQFDNDIFGAAIDDGRLYLFNDEILYLIRTDNGDFARTIVKFDNYRGLSETRDGLRMQTNLEITILEADGRMLPHRRMHMSCIAYGYYIP